MKAVVIETELEDDGRWIAEAPEYPGVMAYGVTEQRAIEAVGRILEEREVQA